MTEKEYKRFKAAQKKLLGSLEAVKLSSSVLELFEKIIDQETISESWHKVYPQVRDILNNKTVIAYNSDFDERMLNQTCRAFGLKKIETQYECLMHNVILEWSSERYIKLADVVDTSQSHRALGDCQLCLEVINRNSIPQEAHND